MKDTTGIVKIFLEKLTEKDPAAFSAGMFVGLLFASPGVLLHECGWLSWHASAFLSVLLFFLWIAFWRNGVSDWWIRRKKRLDQETADARRRRTLRGLPPESMRLLGLMIEDAKLHHGIYDLFFHRERFPLREPPKAFLVLVETGVVSRADAMDYVPREYTQLLLREPLLIKP